MIRLTLTTVFIAIIVGGLAELNNKDGKIIGGNGADIETYPYQVSVEVFGKHHCGGSIINKYKVLTAAHCTHDFSIRNMRVRVGSSTNGEGGQVIDVIDACEHPQYDPGNINKDFSVLTLDAEIEFGFGAQPSLLEVQGAPDKPVGTMANVTGWGVLWEDGPNSKQLQVVELPLVDRTVCQQAYTPYINITDYMICFGFKAGGKDACQYDSGGPLVASGIQIGIVSFGSGCAKPDVPGVYAKISSFRDEIERCVAKN